MERQPDVRPWALGVSTSFVAKIKDATSKRRDSIPLKWGIDKPRSAC